MDYLNIAIVAAKEAGKIHKKYFRNDFKIETKSSSFDLLTTADKEAEARIVSLIREYYPQHNFLGEEQVYEKTSSGYTWIIDPLDGTNNFVCGLGIFCVSIALMQNDEVIIGVVYDATRDELFSAQKNQGAFLNGTPINVNTVTTLEKSLLITGFYYNREEEMIRTLEAIKRFFLNHIRGLRRLGAAALDLCYIASGRASGFWEFKLSPWDFAAGKLLVEEAGGKVTGQNAEIISSKNASYIVASNGRIHNQMLEILKNE